MESPLDLRAIPRRPCPALPLLSCSSPPPQAVNTDAKMVFGDESYEGAGLEGRDIDGDSGDDSRDQDMDQSREEPESPIRLDLDMADWTVEALCKALWRRVER